MAEQEGKVAGITTGGSSEGPATDAANTPVIDPTKNVLDLVEASIRRQDDLRLMTAGHLREMAELRANHSKELRDIETARLNAIRAVDVAAVQQQAQVAQVTATTLAAQVSTSAETLRTQVAAAASAATIALAAALEPVQKDIADLRRAQYEAQGQKTQVVETQAQGANAGMWIGAALGAMMFMVALVGVLIAVLVR